MARKFWRVQLPSLLFGLLTAALLLAAVPVVADVGDPVIQGRFNIVDRRTTITGAAAGDAIFRVANKSATGTGLEIRVEPGQPPLVVNSAARVRHLNADRLDGRSVGSFMLKTQYDADKNRIVDNAERLGGIRAGDFVTKEASWSCAASAWEAIDSSATYSTFGSLKYPTPPSSGGLFRCSVALPDGVYVTSVSFAVEDSSANDIFAAMWRTNLSGAVGGESNMMGVSSAGTPGATVISGTDIAGPRIDNSRYAYFVQAWVVEDGLALGIYGATINYAPVAPPGVAPATTVPGSSTDR